MEAVIFIGIQGSGKSSFYKVRFFNSHVRISMDMLKTKNRQRILFEACLTAKQPFVVDNTNVLAQTRAQFIAPAKAAGFRVVGYYFHVEVREALARNATRTGKQFVPEKGLVGTFRRLQPPTFNEGFDALYDVFINESGLFEVRERQDES
jgi:predicted kinase